MGSRGAYMKDNVCAARVNLLCNPCLNSPLERWLVAALWTGARLRARQSPPPVSINSQLR
jgi:hypothetical protein